MRVIKPQPLDNGIAIEHACGGVCACSTCHVYVEQGMDFVALRLSPGESVTRMQPVRVVTRQ